MAAGDVAVVSGEPADTAAAVAAVSSESAFDAVDATGTVADSSVGLTEAGSGFTPGNVFFLLEVALLGDPLVAVFDGDVLLLGSVTALLLVGFAAGFSSPGVLSPEPFFLPLVAIEFSFVVFQPRSLIWTERGRWAQYRIAAFVLKQV